MAWLRKKLVTGTNADGSPIYQNDPEQLWGIRKALDTALSPAARGTASDQQLAANQFMQVRPLITAAIEKAAPGFDKLDRPATSCHRHMIR
jgi:hypothetical protein